jgi:hypothetical protein
LARRLLRSRSSKISVSLALASLVAWCGLAVAGQHKEAEEAWWVHATFAPAETADEGLSLSAIDPDWVKMTALSYAALPPSAKSDVGWMRQQRFMFQVDQHSKQGSENRALCGVFETLRGQRGRFLLVLERAKGAPWKVAFVRKEVGAPGFSVLVRKAAGLYWGICMQCDEFERLELKKGKYFLNAATAAP